MNIIRKHLSKGNYIAESSAKTHITTHHTVSSSESSTWNWWENDFARDKRGRILKDAKGNPIKSTIGTAYIVDTDGDVIECFPSQYRAHHLGLTGRLNTLMTSFTIGIELVNEGPITLINKAPRWLVDKNRPNGAPFSGEVVTLKTPWRGYSHFAAYRAAQMVSTKQLIDYLCSQYGITKSVYDKFDYNLECYKTHTVISHCNVRKDKTDVSPAFNFELIK